MTSPMESRGLRIELWDTSFGSLEEQEGAPKEIENKQPMS